MSEKCGATARNGKPCPLSAGFGTEHLGQGRCKFHGGNAGRPPTHGKYSDPTKAPAGLKAKAEILLESGDPTKRIEQHLVHMESLYLNWLELHGDDEQNLTNEHREHALMILDRIGKLTDRIEKIRARSSLTRAEVNYFQARAADVIGRFLPDRALQKAFMKELREAAPGPNPMLDEPAGQTITAPTVFRT